MHIDFQAVIVLGSFVSGFVCAWLQRGWVEERREMWKRNDRFWKSMKDRQAIKRRLDEIGSHGK